MKTLFTLLLISICSFTFGQSGTITKIDYAPVATNATAPCIALQFTPINYIAKDSLIQWVKMRLTLEQFDSIAASTKFNDKLCNKCIEVMLMHNEMSFKLFRKLIYE